MSKEETKQDELSEFDLTAKPKKTTKKKDGEEKKEKKEKKEKSENENPEEKKEKKEKKEEKKEEGDIDELDITKNKKPKKESSVDPKELKKIEKNAEKYFDVGTKKKKKKRNPQVKKITAMKLEAILNDDTEEFLEQIKEQKKNKKEEEDQPKKKETSGGSYWTQPIKPKDEEKSETKIEEKENEKKQTGQEDWIKTERDYYYNELVDRIYGILKTKNPQLCTEKNKRIVMKPPQVYREGTTKTNFANFQDICNTMNRPPEHVQSFLLSEMGSTASIDGNGCLIIKGKFQGKGIENLLKKYLQEYVICSHCGSLETTLTRNSTTRLHSLHCSNCTATRTVNQINKGYQTVANKKEKKALQKQE